MKETLTAFGIGAANTICAAISYQGMVNMITLLANALVAIISLGFGVYKIIKILINHFKNKHDDTCSCSDEINDIINKK